jgi:hypothetical protein
MLTISRGTPSDYTALAHHHYRASRPATMVRILRATDDAGRLAGVLVVSMPALNAPWRDIAWPEGAPWHARSANDCHRLNSLVRTISRVIIDPRFRAIGLAQALTRAYLSSPLTPCTESLASMCRWCPFLSGAGMRRVSCPRAARDTRLIKALRELRVPPWRLIDLTNLETLLERPALREALTRWANDGGATRRISLHSAALRAGCALAARPLVFVSP